MSLSCASSSPIFADTRALRLELLNALLTKRPFGGRGRGRHNCRRGPGALDQGLRARARREERTCVAKHRTEQETKEEFREVL